MEQVLARDVMKDRDPRRYGIPDNKITSDEYRTVQRQARGWTDNWFTDKDVAAWLDVGVRHDAAAALWREHGFDASSAAAWLDIRVQPASAAVFTAAGVTPWMLQTPYAMKGKALRGGNLTLKQALEHQDVTAQEVCSELVRLGLVPRQTRGASRG